MPICGVRTKDLSFNVPNSTPQLKSLVLPCTWAFLSVKRFAYNFWLISCVTLLTAFSRGIAPISPSFLILTAMVRMKKEGDIGAMPLENAVNKVTQEINQKL